RVSTRTVEPTIAQNDPLQRRRLQHPVFKRDNAAYGCSAIPLRPRVEWIALCVGFGSCSVCPAYALRHQTANVERVGGYDKISGSYFTNASVANDRRPHQAGSSFFGRSVSWWITTSGRAASIARDSSSASNTSTRTGSTPSERKVSAFAVDRVVP